MSATTDKYLVIREGDGTVWSYRDSFDEAMKMVERLIRENRGNFRIFELVAGCKSINTPQWTIADKKTNGT